MFLTKQNLDILYSSFLSVLPPLSSQVSLQQKEFLANGGDPAWTEGGIQSLPAKMLNFLTVNKLLAHQPWLVTPVHMKVDWLSILLNLTQYLVSQSNFLDPYIVVYTPCILKGKTQEFLKAVCSIVVRT